MRRARTACLAFAALFLVAAGTVAGGHYLSPIPSSSIVLRVGCTGLWEACQAADLQPGDRLLLLSQLTNVTTGRRLMGWGSIGFELDGLNYYATVRAIHTGWTDAGACATVVTSYGPGGQPCSSTFLPGSRLAIYPNLPADCDFLRLPNHLKFRRVEHLKGSDGLWWLVSQAPKGSQCTRVCCQLGQHCECTGPNLGCPDRIISSAVHELAAPASWVTLKMGVPSAWVARMRQQIGPGAWQLRLAVPIQGDRWTDRTDPAVDQVGHAVAMDVLDMVVP